MPTEAPNEAPTEAPTVAPTEAPTEMPTEPETIPVTESMTQPETEAPAETAPSVEEEPESKSWIGLVIVGVVAVFLLLGMIAVRAGGRRGKYSKRRRKG